MALYRLLSFVTLTHVGRFSKFSLLDATQNVQQNLCHISNCTLSMTTLMGEWVAEFAGLDVARLEMTDEVAKVEIAGLDNDKLDNYGLEIGRACTHSSDIFKI